MQKTDDVLFRQWGEVCTNLQRELGDKIAVRWLTKLIPSALKDNQLHLLAPSPCIQELVKKNYADQILSFWQMQDPHIEKLSFELKKHDEPVLKSESAFKPEIKPAKPAPAKHVEQKIVDTDGEVISSFLDPTHTFDTFVVGKPNEFAYAAAKRLAEEESISFNPLYLHSSVGLGKTHLMHAIAWRMNELYPDKTVLYLSAEQFFHRFIKAMRSNNTEAFRDLFRSVDVLMVDDVQFIFGKKATQEEFFHTFNTLIAKGKKIILSADSSPADLHGIEERLQTRIAQGLVVDIHPTSYELRLGILQEKASQKSVAVPYEVLDFLAQNITSNVRELEGALNRLAAHAELIGGEINMQTVRQVLKDILKTHEKAVTVPDIQKMTADYYGLKIADLKSVRRERRIARPRQLAMYLSKQMTTLSLPDIAAHFGRDHTTIIHAVKLIESLIQNDHQLGKDMQNIIARLKEG